MAKDWDIVTTHFQEVDFPCSTPFLDPPSPSWSLPLQDIYLKYVDFP